MFGYLSGVVTGCLIGVSATLVLLLASRALPDQTPNFMKKVSVGTLVPSLAAIAVLTAWSYHFHLGKDASVLLLLLCVLTVSEFTGFGTTLVVTVVTAFVITLVFLSPGSLKIERPKDRLLLALFLLAATLGSRLIRKTRQWAAQRS